VELLRRLSEAPGVPGREEAIRALVREALVNHVDEIEVDLLGNLIAHKKGRGPKVVVAAHMDEIGFFVSHIDEENGFLRLEPVGGFDARTLIASRVVVHTEKGPLLGLIGIKPIHILTEEEKKKEIPDSGFVRGSRPSGEGGKGARTHRRSSYHVPDFRGGGRAGIRKSPG
jgi:aminopeptidase. Metallo peptidase. MEROPS family M42